MDKKAGEKGFTLVEVIVSIAIMGMLLMVLLTFMMGSSKIIHEQGDRTDILYTAQEELENAIVNPDYQTDENNPLEIKRTPLSIMSNGNNIGGVMIEIKDKEDNKVILSHFIPDGSKDSDE